VVFNTVVFNTVVFAPNSSRKEQPNPKSEG
jgi:hypothetical protein